MEKNNYSCIENFDTLKKGDRVFLGSHPDARIANFQRKVTIAANHPSQRRYCFRDGYLKFEEISEFFDRHERCLVPPYKDRLLTERIYVFRKTSINQLRFDKQQCIPQIRSMLVSAGESGKIAIAELVFEMATGRKRNFSARGVDEVLNNYLPEVSLPQLEEFAGLLVSNTPDVDLAA